MPGQQDSSTPASTGSESLRANAAEFVPKLRATATAFVPSSSYVYATPRMQVGMPPIQRPSFYAPRHHRIDVPGLPPNPAMMNHHPMMSMGQHPYHFQQGYMGAPIHPQFHPGMVQGSVMMPHDPQSNRRRTMSPSKPMEEEVVKHHAVAVDATSQPENLIATDKLEADRKSAVEGRSAQDVSDSAIERPDGCELEHELQDSEEQPRVEASAVPPAEVSSSELPAEVSDSLSHPDVSVADTVETEVEAPGKTIPESSMSPNQPAVVSTEPDLATGDEASGCAAESGSENMETSENQVADNSEPESSEISALRYTVQQILEVRDRIQAEKDVNRPPAVVIDPVKYSVQEIMTFQNKFNDTPAFVNPSLDCIGSPLASRPQSSAGGARDRRSSVDRRGYHGSGQRERGARVYDKARSRDPSRSREISRANFGHLQGTVKPIDERDNRRRQDRERDRFDGPVRAVEPQIEPLAMSDNRYIVKKDVQGEELALRQVQSVLNKLTPEKFDRLVTQLIELIMSHLDHLEKIIGLVFDKAVNEFNFAHMYSDLCHCLHKRLAGHESEVGRFRVILLERCRLEFESRSQASESIGSISDEDERETAIFLSRRRSRGLLTFIGHLFNRQLLHFQVINRCLAQLTPHTSIQCGRNIEWDIEDTCTLWAVMGKKYASLRNEDVQKVVEVSFQIIENVIEAREVSSRMIFMLKDLVDLRNNRWEPRRELVVASTLAEVHKKAAQEALAKERAAQKADRAERRRRDDRDPRFESRRSTSVALGNTFGSGDGRSRLSTVDGWSHKVSKSKRGVNASDQPIRVSHSVKDLKSYQPAGRSAEVQESKPSVNAFSLLTHSDDEEETQTPVATSAEETEGEEVSYDTSASDQELSLPEVDENEVRNRVKRMVEEFVSIEDYNEVLLATSELPSPSLHHVVVSESLSFAAEGKPKARELIPKMILHLFQNGKLSGDQITAGLSEFLELLEDLEIDIPKIRCHTGEFIARFIEGQALPVSYLVTIANFKHVPLKTLQSMNAESLPDLIRGENLDLHAVLSASFPLKEGGDMSSFLLNNDLQSLIQCLR